MHKQEYLLRQINNTGISSIPDILVKEEGFSLHDIQLQVVSSHDDELLARVMNMLNEAGGGLMGRTIDDLRTYVEQGAMFVIKGRVNGDSEPSILFTFSIEPGQDTNIQDERLVIYERGAMAINPRIKKHGLALRLIKSVYDHIPQIADLFVLVTSVNPSVWYNNLALGMVPVAIDENDQMIDDLITWTCVCKQHVTNDIPPGQHTSHSLSPNPDLHQCFKRLKIGDQIIYPIREDGRFRQGSDIIFITRQMYDLFRNEFNTNIQDVSVPLYNAIASDPRLTNKDAATEARLERLRYLRNQLQSRGYTFES